MLRLILLLMLIAISGVVQSQDKTFPLKHISSEDGLSDNQVTCIIRDRHGFMWFGTKDGLNRYDGREFYVFRRVEGDSTSVCGNSITCLSYDKDSLLWVGTASSGFCSYDFRTGKFTGYNKSNTPLLSNSINVITYDEKRGCLWLGLNNHGLQTFDLKTKKIFGESDTLSGSHYDVVLKDSLVYMAKIARDISFFDGRTITAIHHKNTSGTVNRFLIDSENRLWMGKWDNALHEWQEEIDSIHYYIFDKTNKLNFSGDEIISLAEDNQRILWCGTKSSGIHFFDLKAKRFLNNYKISPSVASRISSIYCDDHNRMWVGTDLGLYVYNPLQNQFTITKLPVKQDITSCKAVGRAFTKGKKEFVATSCGLFYRNTAEAEYSFKEFFMEKEKLQLFSIYKDVQDRIFIGTNKSVYQLDTAKIILATLYPGKKIRGADFYSISSSRVNAITELARGEDTLLMPVYYGHCAFLIDHKRKNIFPLINHISKPGRLYENLIRKIYIDSRKNIWICGASQGIVNLSISDTFNAGTYPYNDTIMPWVPFELSKWKNKNSGDIAAINDVFDIVENTDGTFWITTQGSGLVMFNPADEVTPFTPYEGNYKALQGITKTENNNLWIISSTGLLNYDIANNRYIRFDKSDGIPDGLSGYFFNDKSSSISAGFNGGFVTFNPNSILKDTEKPKVHVTRLWVMDKPSDSLLHADLKLKYTNNFLKFYISANCFTNNEQLTYMYLLEGIDEEWRNNENNPLITYTNLPHGRFTLKVKVINSAGLESEVASIPITIIPPFYKTVYFYVLVALAISIAAYTFYRYRIKQILKLQEVRNKIARDLHDDIGSTLGSIHLYSQIAHSKMNGDNNGIKSILEKIESSSSEIIDRTGDAVWAVKATNDTLKNLVLRMESYAASILGAAEISFTINYDERIAEMKIEMTERKNIFLIYKEAIHNILKYASCNEVTISLKKENEKLHLIISDNGRGFDMLKVNAYNGNGIKNMQSRAEEIKGIFSLESKPGIGTTITIIV